MPHLQRYGKLFASDTGTDGARPPIVLLPGLTFDHRVWAPVVEALRVREPHRRVLAFDLPGHGQSPGLPSHDLPSMTDVLHDAIEAAGARSPVLVGHSMSGGLVSLYAARFEAATVVNVDQPPVLGPFGQLLRSLEPRLRGAEFATTWADVFAASFHTELLPPPARRLVEANSAPSQGLVLSYWQMLLDHPVTDLQSLVDASLAEIGRRDVPYLLVLGDEPVADVLEHLRAHLPAIELRVWPGSGHFPHLARVAEFAELVLAATPGGDRATQQREEVRSERSGPSRARSTGWTRVSFPSDPRSWSPEEQEPAVLCHRVGTS